MGCLYIRSGLKLRSFIHGGAQERSRRAGTENIPGIVGFGKALERAVRIMPEKIKKETELRDYLIKQIYEKIPYCRLNGDRSRRLPGNVNFSFQFVEGESLLIMLDMKGICGSSGSACTSGALDPSHVLLALGLSHEACPRFPAADSVGGEYQGGDGHGGGGHCGDRGETAGYVPAV